MRAKELYNGRKIPLREVLDHVDENTPNFKSAFFDGADVNVGMLNIKLYAAKGCDCVHCGLEGKFFRVERMGKGNSVFNEWHLNLYGINEMGLEVMMTKDHIHAKSKGGPDELRNLQTMCEKCNVKKKDMPMHEFQKKHARPNQTQVDQTKYSRHYAKVEERMRTRYSIQIDSNYFDDMNRKAKIGRIVKDLGNGMSVREINMHGSLIKVFYSVSDKCIISAMEDRPDSWFHTEMVPSFAKNQETRAKEIYNTVINRAKEQLKIFDTPAETAKYIQGCDYSAVMFCLWKSPGDDYRISHFVWTEVHKIFKSLNISEEYFHNRPSKQPHDACKQ